MRFVIAAGGTAGHVVPALAVAAELQADGHEVVWIGGERAEKQLVPEAGIDLRTIAVEGLSRTNPLKAARAALRAGAAVRTAGRILHDVRPDAVLGGGGYVAGPVGLAAVALRIPLVLAEADSHMGLTNRLLSPRARRVCLAFAIPGREGDRYRVTGRPVPARVAGREDARRTLGIGSEDRVVLVFGGSLGARTINHAAPAAFADAPYRVLHIAGRRDFADLTAPGPHYDLRDYLVPFGLALAASDLAVARAGGSIFELAQHGLPAVLIPYPHATADHQSANARWMRDGGAAVVVRDEEITPERLRAEVDAILLDPPRLAAMREAACRLARPDAAAEIAGEVLAAARKRAD